MEFEQKGSKGTKQESKLSKSTRAIISLLSNLITKWEWWGGGRGGTFSPCELLHIFTQL